MIKCRMFNLDNYLAVSKKKSVSRCRPLYCIATYTAKIAKMHVALWVHVHA